MREIIAGDTGRHGGRGIDAPVIIPYRRYAAATLQLYDFICMSMATALLRDLRRGRGLLSPLTPGAYGQLCQLVWQVICGSIDSRAWGGHLHFCQGLAVLPSAPLRISSAVTPGDEVIGGPSVSNFGAARTAKLAVIKRRRRRR